MENVLTIDYQESRAIGGGSTSFGGGRWEEQVMTLSIKIRLKSTKVSFIGMHHFQGLWRTSDVNWSLSRREGGKDFIYLLSFWPAQKRQYFEEFFSATPLTVLKLVFIILIIIILLSGNFWSATPASPLTVPTVETVATTYPSGLQNYPKFLNIWCTNCHVDVSWLKIPAWHISLNINSSQPWAFILTSRNLFFNRLPYISTPYQHFNTCAQLPNQTSRNRDDDNKFLNLFQTTHVPIWTFWNLIYPCPPNLAFME